LPGSPSRLGGKRLAAGMEEMSEKFREMGAEVYVEAAK
jgi:hypothetical protein